MAGNTTCSGGASGASPFPVDGSVRSSDARRRAGDARDQRSAGRARIALAAGHDECEKFVAFALTEPNDGSDVVRFETRARRDWRVLSGAKRWIGVSPIGDLILIWTRGEDGRGDVGASSSTARMKRFDPAIKPWAITGKRATLALHQADGLIEELRGPLEHCVARHPADMEAVDTWEWLIARSSEEDCVPIIFGGAPIQASCLPPARCVLERKRRETSCMQPYANTKWAQVRSGI